MDKDLMNEDVVVDANYVDVTDVELRPFMSVVIPAYNCRAEIERLLDSIVVQNWSKENLEVIICDDNSTDNFMELVTPYYEKLNIKYFKTEPRDIHCPGNTRKDGLSHVTGEWVTFIDNDDAFDEGAFDMIKDTIVTKNVTNMVYTIFHEYIPEQFINRELDPNTPAGYGRDMTGNTWLHGNWYNMQWLKDNNIDFKENLESHEDLYFNSLCMATLMVQGTNYTIPDANASEVGRKYAYTWIFRPNSLSRGYFSTEHYYIETYLSDYIYSATEPWKHFASIYCQNDQNPEFRIACLQQCLFTLMYAFFYWEAGYYRLGPEKILPNNINVIRDTVDQICFRFKITKSDIIAFVYSNPAQYQVIKNESFTGGGAFIELHTFRDFILSL